MSYRTSEEWVYKGLDTVRRFEREASLRKKQIYNKCRVRGPAAMLGRASKQCVHHWQRVSPRAGCNVRKGQQTVD